MFNVKKLVSIAGCSIAEVRKLNAGDFESRTSGELLELENMLALKNGFYAFESALHVYPTYSSIDEVGLAKWNAPGLWRFAYGGMAENFLFFAEDIFGSQFCMKGGKVYLFDPETGQVEQCSNTLDEWAANILNDYAVLTGYPLARSWQLAYGAIPPGSRLLPKIPFVLGGEYSLENLYLAESVQGMLSRAQLALQIRHLPDGARIKMQVNP